VSACSIEAWSRLPRVGFETFIARRVPCRAPRNHPRVSAPGVAHLVRHDACPRLSALSVGPNALGVSRQGNSCVCSQLIDPAMAGMDASQGAG
jgi:hypothetical protein